MKRFLIHSLNHTTLLVDISEIGLPTEIYPREGKPQTVTSIRFQTWSDAENYLRELGASSKLMDRATETLKKGVAVLTIP